MSVRVHTELATRTIGIARAKAICRCWCAAVSTIILAIILSILLLQMSIAKRATIVDAIACLGWPFLSILAFGVSAVMVGAASWQRVRAFLGVPHFFACPPLWLVTVVSLMGTAIAISYTNDGDKIQYGCVRIDDFGVGEVTLLAAAGVSGLVASSLFGLLVKTPAPTAPAKQEASIGAEGSINISAWLDADDTPISHPDDDLFGYVSEIARRLVRRVASNESRHQPSPSFVIFGPLGSGKTSIFHVAKFYCQDRKQLHSLVGDNPVQVQWAYISAWPHANFESLLSAILSEVVRAIHCRVDCFGLQGMGYRYVASVSSGVGVIGRLADLIAAEQREPACKISRIEQLLLACDLRVLIWIDDMERFVANDGDDRPIEALLSLFRVAPHLSFVLCRGVDSGY